MSWWHRWVHRTIAGQDAPQDSVVGCRSTILPPPPSHPDSDSAVTLRVPRVPRPANDLLAWTGDTVVRELGIDEDLSWDEQDVDCETRPRQAGFRPEAPTWKCRVA